MSTHNCIIVSYRGLKHFIVCDANTGYETFIGLVCERFKIRKEHKNAILLTNGLSYVFNKDLFEYYILLFPNPHIIFHVRLDFSKISIFHKLPTLTKKQLSLSRKRSYAEIVEDDTEMAQRNKVQYIKRHAFNTTPVSRHKKQIIKSHQQIAKYSGQTNFVFKTAKRALKL